MKIPTVSEALHAIRVLDTIEDLRKAVINAHGGGDIVDRYLDKPMREFIEHVAAPNNIRASCQPGLDNLYDSMERSVKRSLEACEFLERIASSTPTLPVIFGEEIRP